MKTVKDEVEKLGGHGGKIDWQTAEYLFRQGKTPQEAAHSEMQHHQKQAALDMTSPEMVEQFKRRIIQEVTKHIHGAGKVVDVMTEGAGHGWLVVVDTEYAALKLYYVYRNSNPHLDKGPHGWAVSLPATFAR